MNAPRPQITAATRTAEGARLDLSTGDAVHVEPSDWAALSDAPPYVLTVQTPAASWVLDVPAPLLAQVAQVLDIHSRAPDALPVLLAVHVEAQRVTFTTREQGAPSTRRLTLPRPLAFSRSPQLLAPDVLTVYALPPLAPQVARYAVEPYTAEGQAALVALGYPGPYPVPEGVTLGGYAHGTALTEHEALTLAGLPDFADDWVLCPSESGGAPFTLLWGNAASDEQLERSSTWATLTAASLRASDTPRGSA